jgi:hypothetical protein
VPTVGRVSHPGSGRLACGLHETQAFGGAVSAPYVIRLSDAVLQDRPERDALLGRRLTVILAIDALVYILIIADMVLKPFGY